MAGRHEGKVAVVTGAAIGLGQAYAYRLASDGADVCIADVSDATETLDRVAALGRGALSIRCDVTSQADVDALAAQVNDRFGRCDILVNNAGIYPLALFADMGFATWRRMLATNLDSVFLMCKAFVPAMRERGYGRVINIASTTAWLPIAGLSHYIASKYGVIGFSRGLASEVGDDGVTVNVLCPGLVPTATTRSGPQSEWFEQIAQQQAIKRVETPEEVADVLSFLASDDARFVTAQTLLADGGLVRL